MTMQMGDPQMAPQQTEMAIRNSTMMVAMMYPTTTQCLHQGGGSGEVGVANHHGDSPDQLHEVDGV